MTRRTALAARAAVLLAAPVLLMAGAVGCSAGREVASTPPFGSDSVVPVPGSIAATPTTVATRIEVEHLAMVGDSITVGATDALETAFAGLGLEDPEINAQSGRRMVVSSAISSGVDGVQAILEHGDAPDLWVIALGTNDVVNYGAEEYAGAIDELLAAVPAGAPVVWVDSYLATYPDESAAFDDVLRQVLAERGNASVVDWSSIAPEDGMLTDGVHPSGYGQDQFAGRVSAAVEDWMA